MRKIYLTAVVLLTLVFTSCELDINRDPNYPTDVQGDKFFTSGLMWTASVIGGDLELVGGMWSQHYAQHASANQYSNIDTYNLPNNSSYITRAWSALYAGALPDFQIAMQKSEAAGDWQYWMASKIMTAYCFHLLADAYGNVPCRQALDFEMFKNPVFDDAKSVNDSLLLMLDAAIAKKTEAASKSSMGANDFVFGGDIDQWVKFAKSLKLKILLRDPDFPTRKPAIQDLIDENDFLTDDCRIAVFTDKENNSNPLYENDRRKLGTTQNIRASSTLSLYLWQNSDPRAAVYMEKAFTPDPVHGDYVGLPQGGYTLGAAYANLTSRARLQATDPVYFMSLAELHFLKAEVYVLLSDNVNAKTEYDNGVIAAFDRWKDEKDENNQLLYPASFDVNDFIGTGKPYEFNTTSSSTMLNSIWRQVWIAGVRAQAWEAFNTINRTGYPVYGSVDSQNSSYVIGDLAPSMNSVLPAGEFPRRLIYPKTSTDYNTNTPATIPIQTKLWWHK